MVLENFLDQKTDVLILLIIPLFPLEQTVPVYVS